MRKRPVKYGNQLAIRFGDAQIRQIDRYCRDYSVDGRTEAVRQVLAAGFAAIERRESKARES